MRANVVVIDRKSSASGCNTVEFETFAELRKEVDSFLDQLPFYKVCVEIEPLDFTPTSEQEEEIRKIEEE